ncbi:hypothetical protein BRADI_2g36992v3 [Brachypodium distachyon]|uniref:Uncharacterized protein n=1 Tax=Brachypodium distachyon TaxID=15368 RepID=A0A2K2DCA9_BRADI|nr:hypothetical protein BRADI_2g36992v3 [Brachypodium distachyon]
MASAGPPLKVSLPSYSRGRDDNTQQKQGECEALYQESE